MIYSNERGSVIEAQKTLLEINPIADAYWKYWWIDWYVYTGENWDRVSANTKNRYIKPLFKN